MNLGKVLLFCILPTLLLGATKPPAAAGAKMEKKTMAPAKEKKILSLPTRRMDEMTSREVELYFQAGGDLVFIPFGPVSGHGAFIPLGIHGHWAHALSVLMAEKANGLVYPPVFTCFAGGTSTFRGTVSFTMAEQAQILERIVTTLQQQGFKRIVLVAGTTPEDMGGTIAARTIFDKTEKPVWMLIGERLLKDSTVKAVFDGYPGNFGETQIGLASLKILGRERPIPCPEWAKEVKIDDDPDQPKEIHPDIVKLRTLGTVGFRFYEEGNHGNHGNVGLTFKGRSDIDMAVEVLERCADEALPALESLGRYADWLEKHPFQYIVPVERLK